MIIFEINTLEFLKCNCLNKNINSLYLGLKCWVFLGNSFIGKFEITTLDIVKFQSVIQNKNTLNLVPKIPFVENLGTNVKKLLSFLKSESSNLSDGKFHLSFEFRTKNTIFWYL